MRRLIAAVIAMSASMMTTFPALAQACTLRQVVTGRCQRVASVPEIDVSSGLLALAALGAATLLVWEIRRRRRAEG